MEAFKELSVHDLSGFLSLAMQAKWKSDSSNWLKLFTESQSYVYMYELVLKSINDFKLYVFELPSTS